MPIPADSLNRQAMLEELIIVARMAYSTEEAGETKSPGKKMKKVVFFAINTVVTVPPFVP